MKRWKIWILNFLTDTGISLKIFMYRREVDAWEHTNIVNEIAQNFPLPDIAIYDVRGLQRTQSPKINISVTKQAKYFITHPFHW